MPSDPSGVLTPKDREFLRSDGDFYTGEYANQSKYERQRAIRARIVRSLLDFQDIRTYLNGRQRAKIFDDPAANGAEDELEFRAALESLIAWVYLGCRESGMNFESLLSSGVTRAEEDYQQRHGGDVVDVKVDFDVEVSARYEGVEELGRALENGEPVFARNLYKVPMVREIPVNPEKVDVVRIHPESAQRRPEREKSVVESILREYLGIEADVEVVGVAELPDSVADDLEDGEEPTGAVAPEDYFGGTADEPDS